MVRKRRAISWVELLVAVLMLGLVAALTIPRLGQAAGDPPVPAAAVERNLKILRCAVEAYRQDHGVWPGVRGDGRHPAGTPAAFVAQLTAYTDASGHVAPSPDDRHRFGPYLRDGIPPCPLAATGAAEQVLVVDQVGPAQPQPGANTGWVYNVRTGEVIVNSDMRDHAGRPYAAY